MALRRLKKDWVNKMADARVKSNFGDDPFIKELYRQAALQKHKRESTLKGITTVDDAIAFIMG